MTYFYTILPDPEPPGLSDIVAGFGPGGERFPRDPSSAQVYPDWARHTGGYPYMHDPWGNPAKPNRKPLPDPYLAAPVGGPRFAGQAVEPDPRVAPFGPRFERPSIPLQMSAIMRAITEDL